MAQKIPPPPQFTGPEWQQFNRWLLEIQSILSNEGGISPDEVTGLPALFTQVATNTTDIVTLEGTTGGQGSDIATLQAQVANIDGVEIPAINGQLTTLGSRSQVFNGTGAPAVGLGTDNDWYYNRTGAAGNRLFIKLAGAWVAQAI